MPSPWFPPLRLSILAAVAALIALVMLGRGSQGPGPAASAQIARADQLIAAGQFDAAEPLLARIAGNSDPKARLWAYQAWAQILGPRRGDFAGFMDKEGRALRLDPDSAAIHLGLYQGETVLGHDGAAVAHLDEAARSAFRLGPLRLGAAWMTPHGMRALLDRSRGDYAGAARQDAASLAADPPGSASARADRLNRIGDLILAHEPADDPPAPQGDAAHGVEAVLGARDRAYAAMAREDWTGAAAALQGLEAAPLSASMRHSLAVLTRPWLAYALFRSGQTAAARAQIADTPADCYLCQRVRGRLAAEAGDAAAERAFAAAVVLAPDLPFAYVERGRARLARGDVAGALADCALAKARSPNFADAPELCGEAWLRRGDPAAAARAFSLAGRLAPHWGRNHMLWAVAVRGSGGKG